MEDTSLEGGFEPEEDGLLFGSEAILRWPYPRGGPRAFKLEAERISHPFPPVISLKARGGATHTGQVRNTTWAQRKIENPLQNQTAKPPQVCLDHKGTDSRFADTVAAEPRPSGDVGEMISPIRTPCAVSVA